MNRLFSIDSEYDDYIQVLVEVAYETTIQNNSQKNDKGPSLSDQLLIVEII